MHRLIRAGFAAVCLTVFSLAAHADVLRIEGLADDQVLQRGRDNNASIEIRCIPDLDAVNDLQFRITSRGLVVPGFEWRAAEGRGEGISACAVKNLPVGGPYDIEIQARDKSGKVLTARTIRSVLVGDLWVLGGQSNMEGVARLDGAEEPDGLVHMFDMNDEWRIATEPLHERALSIHPVYWNVNEPAKGKRLEGEDAWKFRQGRRTGAGLGLAFAKELVGTTGVPIGLLPCAYGGTSMDQWSPARKGEGSNSLYGAALNRINSAGGKITGVLWYQGESDANPDRSAAYGQKMKDFIAAWRADTGQSDLPFLYVQIGRYVTNSGPRTAEDWNLVQDVERQLESQIPRTGVVATIDQDLDDLIHVDTKGLVVVGHRLANLAGIMLFADRPAYKNLKPGPRLKGVSIVGNDKRRVRVEFTGVNGSLVSAGRVAGFSTSVVEGDAQQPFKAFIDPEKPDSIVLLFQNEVAAGTRLHYGRGMDPYCNVADEAGMGLLVFGPVEISMGTGQ
jgi:sialate O-acetylesterase